MLVETLLGLDDEGMGRLAADRWAAWAAIEPRLAQVERPEQLDAWRRRAAPVDANAMLLGLARLAAFDGEDDPDAARVLAWLVLPTVLSVRRQLSWLGEGLDEAVAAQLWIGVRSVAWRKRHWVVRQLGFTVRESLQVERGVATQHHPTLAAGPLCRERHLRSREVEPAASETLTDLLEWAFAQNIISEADLDLLASLLATAHALEAEGTLPRDGGAAGLASNRVTADLAVRLGVCQRTIRRRTDRCLEALSAASSRFFEEVAV